MSMNNTYSTDFHKFAEEVMEDLSVLNLPLSLRTLDRYSWMETQLNKDLDPAFKTMEFIDVTDEVARYAPCVSLRYAYEYMNEGHSHDETLVKVINDIEREVNQYVKEEAYLHVDKAQYGQLLNVLETINKLRSGDILIEEGIEINPPKVDYDKDGNVTYIHEADFQDTYYPVLELLNDSKLQNSLDNVREDKPGYFTDDHLINHDDKEEDMEYEP